VARRALFACFLGCLAALGLCQRASNPVLILVQPGLPNLFDPTVDPDSVVHDGWILWPAEKLPSSASRLLTIATGIDWAGERGDRQFEWAGKRTWKSIAFKRLKDRGHFLAREKVWRKDELFALTNGTGEASRDALLLALGPVSPYVRTVDLQKGWPVGRTLVIEATRAEDIRQVMARTKGRVLVVEYPPPHGQNWSHIWTKGNGWPEGIPTDSDLRVPGLIGAGKIASFLRDPESFHWRPTPPAWTGANRWFSYVAVTRLPLFVFLGVLALALGFAGAYTVGQERRSLFLTAALRALTLLPAAMVAGGNLAYYAGLSGIAVWTVVAWAALSGLAATINLAIVKAGWKPDMLGYGVVGLIALLVSDPRLSIYSPVFSGASAGVPPEPLGALLVSSAIVLGCFRPWRRVTRLVVFGAVVLLISAGSALPVWWRESGVPVGLWILPAVCWARDRRLLFSGGIATGIVVGIAILLRGFAYLPGGLIATYSQVRAINTFDLIHAWVSPPAIGLAVFIGAVSLFGTKFLGHQVRLAWREQDAARIAAGSAGCCLALSVAVPRLFESAVYVFCGVVIILLESLLRTADPIEDD